MRFFFLLWGAALFGHIVEAPHIRQVDHYLTPDCLLILDIDDTLLIPAQMLGCDEWFSLRLKQRLDRGVSFAKALEKSLAEWEAVRHLTKMEIVEPAADGTLGVGREAQVLKACVGHGRILPQVARNLRRGEIISPLGPFHGTLRGYRLSVRPLE